MYNINFIMVYNEFILCSFDNEKKFWVIRWPYTIIDDQSFVNFSYKNTFYVGIALQSCKKLNIIYFNRLCGTFLDIVPNVYFDFYINCSVYI